MIRKKQALVPIGAGRKQTDDPMTRHLRALRLCARIALIGCAALMLILTLLTQIRGMSGQAPDGKHTAYWIAMLHLGGAELLLLGMLGVLRANWERWTQYAGKNDRE